MTEVTAHCRYNEASLSAARLVADDAWAELRRSPYVQQRLGAEPVGLPDLSFEEAQRRAGVGRVLLDRIAAIDSCQLPHDLALTLRLVRFRANIWSNEARWYWTVIEPRGTGQFGLFLPTAYCGGYVLSFAYQQLGSFSFRRSDDLDRYLDLVSACVRLIDQFAVRTAGQAERGMRMPKVQVIQARRLLLGFKASARGAFKVDPNRVGAACSASFMRELDKRVTDEIEPMFERAIDGLSDEYLSQAPDLVGMSQYAQGTDIYAQLVRQHTTLDISPEEVHARGLERMTEIEGAITDLQTQIDSTNITNASLSGTPPEWRANTVDGVSASFQRYLDRLEPMLYKYFSVLPHASYGVAPLPDALQDSMTFGYFDPPRVERDRGLYLFNTARLTKQNLYTVASLTYHELMPGHHMQFARQSENEDLHPFRKYGFVNAYVEGWAEYAAILAGEMGLYQWPQEKYGRLAMDAFLTSRLIVDTGMNALGWSLERAREYMRRHSRLGEEDICTETTRYSCDIPAQALAYKLGDMHILALRERMRQALGLRFDIKHFHETILRPGALPLSDLEWHLEREIERQLHSSRS